MTKYNARQADTIERALNHIDNLVEKCGTLQGDEDKLRITSSALFKTQSFLKGYCASLDDALETYGGYHLKLVYGECTDEGTKEEGWTKATTSKEILARLEAGIDY